MTDLDRGLLTGGNSVDWSRTSQLLVIETIIAGEFFFDFNFCGDCGRLGWTCCCGPPQRNGSTADKRQKYLVPGVSLPCTALQLSRNCVIIILIAMACEYNGGVLEAADDCRPCTEGSISVFGWRYYIPPMLSFNCTSRIGLSLPFNPCATHPCQSPLQPASHSM